MSPGLYFGDPRHTGAEVCCFDSGWDEWLWVVCTGSEEDIPVRKEGEKGQ